VQIQPTQQPDPTYSLMCGTTDQQAWDNAMSLLARTILLRDPGEATNPSRRNDLNLQTLQWIEPQERPLLMGRTAQWMPEPQNAPGVTGGPWMSLRLGIDIYNASDSRPDQNLLQWTALPPSGWQVKPQPMSIPALATYHVQRFTMDARFNLEEITPASAKDPVEVTFTNGFTKRQSKLRVVLPVAASERREGKLSMDGSLNDWDVADAIANGPLVRLFDRPTLQKQTFDYAQTPSSVYTAWADANFYVAFKVSGVTNGSDVRVTRNFLDYQFRRTWGEDLCQMLIQPLYADNTAGPILHVVCKPHGHWVERKLDPRTNVDPWQAVEGAAVRYAWSMEDNDWRGEVAIPWKALIDPQRGRPTVLRFNFVQHKHSTGESASWAGPLDFGRDDSFMGLLYLREPDAPGMVESAQFPR
jgi:hypothetical protein